MDSRLESGLTEFASNRLAAIEEALHASEDRLRSFIKHAPAAVAMFDQDMRYLQASDRWLSDYHLDGDRIVGQSHYDVFPDAPESWKEAHQRVLAGSIERASEDRFHRADGHVEWLEWEARPWHRLDGTTGGLMIFTQFITERKKSELRIEHLNRVYEVRSDINQAITREKDTRTLLERVCGVAVETGRFLMAWIGMLDDTGRFLTPVAAAAETVLATAAARDRPPRVRSVAHSTHPAHHTDPAHLTSPSATRAAAARTPESR